MTQQDSVLPSFDVIGDVPDVQMPDLLPDAETLAALEDLGSNLGKVPMSRARQAEMAAQEGNTIALSPEDFSVDMPESMQGMLPSFGGSHETTAMQRLGIGRPTKMLLPERTTLDLAQELGKKSGVNVRELKGYPNPTGTDMLSKALRQRGKIAARPGK